MTEHCRQLWAKSKPYHPLWCHLLDAAAVAQALLPRFGPIANLPEGWTPFLVGCHDVGKADRWFQNKDSDLAARLVEVGFELPQWTSGSDFQRRFRHEERSREWLMRALQTKWGWNPQASRVVAKAIVGHHGDWSPASLDENQEKNTEFWATLRDELGEVLWEVLAPVPLPLEKFSHAGVAGTRLAAYVILSDWIASNDALYCYESLPREADPATYFAASYERATRVVSQMNLGAIGFEQAPTTLPTFSQTWPQITKPRPLQSKIEAMASELKPGLAIIEAPMGEGKTEAAVYLATLWQTMSGSRGLYFALPTQATANSIHKRYEKFLATHSAQRHARLMHGGAWLAEAKAKTEAKSNSSSRIEPDELETLPELAAEEATAQAQSARNWFRPMRRAMLCAEGVGTVDQALLCALRVKFGPLRLLGLSQKVLLIDEVHAYDEFMGVLLQHLLRWCRALEINVILLSATLSQAQKQALFRAYGADDSQLSPLLYCDPEAAPYPLFSFVPREGHPFAIPAPATPERATCVQIDRRDGLLEDSAATARLVAETVKEQGGCACVLANTVKAAQEIFQQLEILQGQNALSADCQLSLFHARFRAEKRAKIEAQTVAQFGPDAGEDGNPPRPKSAILVATQVVEQSLDVDFDFLFSQLAPVDLLLQRAGRLWRHARPKRPTVAPVFTVLAPQALDFGSSGRVYSPEILLRSLAICHEKFQWDLPTDFRPLIERGYNRALPLGDWANAPEFQAQLENAQVERDEERAKAQSEAREHLWIEPKPGSFEPVQRGAQEADEDSGEQPKFLVAQTRRGDESVALLILSALSHFELADRDAANAKLKRDEQRHPRQTEMIELFGQKVGAPRWWLTNTTPLEGFEPLADGQSFLRGHKLLRMREYEGKFQWRGRDQRCEFAIIDDPQLGLLRCDLSAVKEDVEEADAGYNTP